MLAQQNRLGLLSMRPLVAIVLTSLLFVSLFGFQITFMAQRAVIHRQMAQKLKAEKKKAATQLVFSTSAYSSLRKFEGGKEFSWQGNMYDVVDKYTEGNNVIVTAYLDHKETSLLSRFLSVFEQENDGKDDASNTVSSFSLTEFIPTENLQVLLFQAIAFTLAQPEFNTIATFIGTTTPPPDLAA